MNLIKSYLLIIFLLSMNYAGFCSDINKSTMTIDTLKSQLVLAKGAERFDILLKLAEQTRRNDPDLALTYMENAKEWVDETKNNKDLFLYFKNLSAVKLSQNQFKESISFAQKAKLLNVKDVNPVDKVEIYQYLGRANTIIGENDVAQQAHFIGLRIADSLALDDKVAELVNAIGIVYLELNDLEMAEKYFIIAVEKAKKLEGDYKMLARANGNLANVYSYAEKYDKSEQIYLNNIELGLANEDKYFVESNYNNLALNYVNKQQFEDAIKIFKKALVLAEEENRPSDIGMTHINLGLTYMDSNNYNLAKKHLDIGLNITKALENKRDYEYALEMSFELYEKTGDYKIALDYYKEYSSLKASLLNEKRIEIVGELEGKYQSEKKEKEILSLLNDKESAKRREKTLIQTIFLLCFGLLGILLLLYFLRQNHKKNSIIQEKNLKIAADKIQLLEKGKEIIALESLIQGQENERQRLAKEMHDGLGGLLAISHSKLTNLNGPEMESNVSLTQARDLIGDAYNQVRQISHNLMPLDLKKFGLVNALTSMIQGINKQHRVNVDFRTYHFDLFLNNELGLNIYRISQEAITNALKYAKARNILIELFQHDDMISLSIEDDGIGFDLNAKNSGIGIRSMRNRTELLNGKFNIEAKVSVGTSIFVLFPYNSQEFKLSQT